MRLKHFDKTQESTSSTDTPKKGDTIRTRKMQMEGIVVDIGESRAGYPEVTFKVGDGRLMKTPVSNVIIIQKLADDEVEVMEDRVDELSTELLAKYKTAAGKAASDADKKGDVATGNKRFSGIVKATKKQFGNDKKKSTDESFEPENNRKSYTDYNEWKRYADNLNTMLHSDGSNMVGDEYSETYDIDGKIYAAWNKRTNTGYVKTVGANEGSMGGINRVPNIGLSYERVLDEVRTMWEESQLNELSVDTLKAYRTAADSPEVLKNAPLRKIVKHVAGANTADQKIKTKTGDQTGRYRPDRGTFEEKLQEFLNMDEADEMGNIVKTQDNSPKPGQTVDKEYNGWIVRYQLAPRVKGQPVQWMAWHNKKDPSTAKKGSAQSSDAAFQDATAFINGGAGEERKYTSNRVTIDFNAQFSKQIVPGGEGFYVKIDDGFIIVSLRPQEGFAKAHPRAETENSERFWSAVISAREAEAQKLVPNGRYSLGSKDDIDAETFMFDLHFQSVAQSSNDRLRMREPGFIVATAREQSMEEDTDPCWDDYKQVGMKDKGGKQVPNCVPKNEAITPWGGYTDDDKKANALAKAPKSSMQGSTDIPFSTMVQDSIKQHGLKWAFNYYVLKNGLPPRHFKIYAGL